jgi:hypothetical protein
VPLMEADSYRQALAEQLNNGWPPDLGISATDIEGILNELDDAYLKLDDYYRKLEDLRATVRDYATDLLSLIPTNN